MTDDWRDVCRVDDVPVGEVGRFELPGLPPLAVYNVDGRFYASDDCCTHEQAMLSEGTLDGEVIECPFHGGSFSVVTGEVVARPPIRPLRVYPVRVEGETVRIQASE